jgi:UDP-glucuronate 4-epimerase
MQPWPLSRLPIASLGKRFFRRKKQCCASLAMWFLARSLCAPGVFASLWQKTSANGDCTLRPVVVKAVSMSYLVTGALGCIGAWTVRTLVRAGHAVTAFDLGTDHKRLRLIMSDAELAQVRFVTGDLTQFDTVATALNDNDIQQVIHLAGLQVPFCRANPVLGAQVNVVGTVNVFEAVRRREGRPARVVYASSAAVFDVDDAAPGETVAADATGHPATLYGVYKQANEGTARIYASENGVASIGLRPYIVYGPGRDQGLTSAPTSAMRAAAHGQPFHIPYGGRSDYEYAADVAATFIACCNVPFEGAGVFNLPGQVLGMRDVVEAIEAVVPESRGTITFDDKQLPFPESMDGRPLDALLAGTGGVPRTPLHDAVAETVAIFRQHPG